MEMVNGVTSVISGVKAAKKSAPFRVLLVGEREEDFFLVRDILSNNAGGMLAELDHAASLEEANAALDKKLYGLILFQHETADEAAVRLVREHVKNGTSIPFILLTETADEAAVAKILEAGAWDCLEKAELNGANLLRTLHCTISLSSMQQDKYSAEESARKLLQAVEQSADAVLMTDLKGRIEYVNPAFEKLTGYSAEEVKGKTPRILRSGQHEPAFYRDLWQTIRAGQVFRGIVVNRKKNGEFYCIEESISPVRDSAGAVTHFISNGRDLTERKRLEAQLQQAQKMDAVGRLAGGVAHDFNNLLTIIISYSELAMDSVEPESPLAAKLNEIVAAGKRAAQLTRQLLAFSRKQPQVLRVLDMNSAIANMTGTLQRLIGEDIQLSFTAGENLAPVRLDPVQLEQVLMNLAANARDAMPRGGCLKIETADTFLSDGYIQNKPAIIPKGRYTLLTVSDNGQGIPPEQLPHIFEPFFTTKPDGKGTGLGLATVYGIVKQNQGFVWVYSEAGMGTVFKIYLPCAGGVSTSEECAPFQLNLSRRGSETILLVEDERAVRCATAEFLRTQGYKVLEAEDGIQALAIAHSFGDPIHLVISDVVMPNMSGGELAKKLASLLPDTTMLFVSGYPGKTVQDHEVLDVGANFLQKPFTLKQLSQKIREIIEVSVA